MHDRRNAQFIEVDFSGARFHGVDLSNVTISDAHLADVEISGMVAGLRVNGVDVTAFVDAELDRRHPERLLLTPDDPAGMRVAWSTIEGLAATTLRRARALPPAALTTSVNGEWTFLDTLRHLVFATDRWITGPVLGEANPFHRLGRPNDPLDEWVAGAFDLDATVTLDEVIAARRDRMDRVARIVDALDDAELERAVESPNGGTTTVRYCLLVVLREEWWHDHYANRDLGLVDANR